MSRRLSTHAAHQLRCPGSVSPSLPTVACLLPWKQLARKALPLLPSSPGAGTAGWRRGAGYPQRRSEESGCGLAGWEEGMKLLRQNRDRHLCAKAEEIQSHCGKGRAGQGSGVAESALPDQRAEQFPVPPRNTYSGDNCWAENRLRFFFSPSPALLSHVP